MWRLFQCPAGDAFSYWAEYWIEIGLIHMQQTVAFDRCGSSKWQVVAGIDKQAGKRKDAELSLQLYDFSCFWNDAADAANHVVNY